MSLVLLFMSSVVIRSSLTTVQYAPALKAYIDEFFLSFSEESLWFFNQYRLKANKQYGLLSFNLFDITFPHSGFSFGPSVCSVIHFFLFKIKDTFVLGRSRSKLSSTLLPSIVAIDSCCTGEEGWRYIA